MMNCLKKNKLMLSLSCCETKLYKSENCQCKYILLIQHYIKKYMNTLKQLPTFEYNKINLSYHNINSFLISEKKTNISFSSSTINTLFLDIFFSMVGFLVQRKLALVVA